MIHNAAPFGTDLVGAQGTIRPPAYIECTLSHLNPVEGAPGAFIRFLNHRLVGHIMSGEGGNYGLLGQ